VIGVDVNPAKVEMVNRGESTIIEEGIGELVERVVREGSLTATTDAAAAVAATEVSMVCVGTPSNGNGSLGLAYLERVCGEIGAALRHKEGTHLVVIRSTVLPGTTESVVIPMLEEMSGRKLGDGFEVCNNPEFLREGTSIRDFYAPPFTLIGATRDSAADRLARLYEGIDAPVHLLDIRAAEMVKYSCNAFHGLKVSFANEIGNICKALEIDSHEVMRVFCADTKLNISPAYLKPGFAFGGSCLPKDLRALTYKARQLDVETPVLSAALESNRQQIERAAEMVMSTGHRRVGVLGLSFKEGTDDLRESPMVKLVETLIGKGMQLAIYDRNVSRGGVLGANREYIERTIPHIWSLMSDSMQTVVDGTDTLVLGNRAAEFRELTAPSRDGQVVIDLVRVFEDRVTDAGGYRGVCW
jgi:GDP-mannose 6-dehydrogenase